MVTTRSGESTDDGTPSKPVTRSSATRTTTASPTPPASPTTRSRATKSPAPTSSSSSSRTFRSSTSSGQWSHTPSNLTLLWLAISLPLVIWDAGYVLLRPHSMPGGYLHSPIWKPYALYAEIDYVYGFPALAQKNGWTATQTWFNVLETIGYAVYLYWVFTFGARDEGEGRGAPRKREVRELEDKVAGAAGFLEGLVERRVLDGKLAGKAVVLGFSVASLTFFKTVMYWVLEYFNEFENIGHNDWGTLILLWVIPNGAWLIGPSYMMYVFGAELLEGLEIAAEGSSRKTK